MLRGASYPTSSRAKAIPTEMKPSTNGDIATLTARLDSLRADQDPNELARTLRTAFEESELYDAYVYSLVGDTEKTQVLLEVFDRVLKESPFDVTTFKRFRQLCGWTGLLPTSHIIPGKLVRTTEYATAFGGFSDVWEGIYNDKRVAIKALRIYKPDDVRKVKRLFCKEVVIWGRMSHPNIVPFLGVSEVSAPLCIVSEWMPNGNLRDYVGKIPEASRLQLLLDISHGLSFLHSLEIVHGDLKGDNILVDGSGRARLNDFGFTTIASLNCMETSAPKFKGTHRWTAPELFDLGTKGTSGLSTAESDVFALGMVTIELFTGQLPFSEYRMSESVIKKIIDGDRPSRPSGGEELGLSDELWGIIQSSWARQAKKRVPVFKFIDFLKRATPDLAVLEELTEFDANSEDDIREVRRMFGYGDNTLLGMRAEETLVLIEVFDQASSLFVLNSSLKDPALRGRCLRGLQKVSARCGLLPKSYWLSHAPPAELSDTPFEAGKISRTRQRLIDGKLVAVKTISPDCIESFDVFKRKLCTHAVMWKRLRHPNVVSFLGFGSCSPPFSLVYPWMPDGNLPEYVRAHPDADTLSLFQDVAHGLAYLHRYNLVHGNLTGRSILVGSDGAASVSGYGLEPILREEASSKSIQTNVRWMAPEVLDSAGNSGKAADIYSFGMVMFEVLTGAAPFSNESDEEIMGRVVAGLRPEWPSDNPPQGLVDELREPVEACWNQEPNDRPTAFMVLQSLQARSKASEMEYANGDLEEVAPLSRLPSIHRRRSSPRRSDGSEHRFGSRRVEKYLRHVLNLSKNGVATMADTAEGQELIVEEPTPGTVIVDQRAKEVMVREGRFPYLVSRPIPKGKTLTKVVVTVVSKDQGWSTRVEDYGTYRSSWTWFELSVGSPSDDSGEKWRGEVVRNIHAHDNFKEHTIEMSNTELYEKAKGGDVLTVWALAKFQGSVNMVKEVTIQYFVQ